MFSIGRHQDPRLLGTGKVSLAAICFVHSRRFQPSDHLTATRSVTRPNKNLHLPLTHLLQFILSRHFIFYILKLNRIRNNSSTKSRFEILIFLNDPSESCHRKFYAIDFDSINSPSHNSCIHSRSERKGRVYRPCKHRIEARGAK